MRCPVLRLALCSLCDDLPLKHPLKSTGSSLRGAVSGFVVVVRESLLSLKDGNPVEKDLLQVCKVTRVLSGVLSILQVPKIRAKPGNGLVFGLEQHGL